MPRGHLVIVGIPPLRKLRVRDYRKKLLPTRRRIPRRVISLPRLDFVAVFGFDFDMTERAVVLIVGWRVSHAVLGAQFLGDLGKCLGQLVGVANGDGAAAGLL